VAFYDHVKVPLVVDIKSCEKEPALRQLTRELCRVMGIKSQTSLNKRIALREESASTFIGQGVALPQTHGPIADDFAIVVGRSVEGVEFDAARGARAHIIVLTIAKADADESLKMEQFSEMASFFKTEAIQEQLLALTGPVDLHAFIKNYTQIARDQNRVRAPRKADDAVIEAAVDLARDIKAAKLLVYADAVRENDFVEKIKLRNKLVVVCSNKTRFDVDDKRINAIINAPSFPASRIGQMKVGVLLGLSRGVLKQEDKVVCLTGSTKNGEFDTIVSLNIEAEYEFFFTDTKNLLPADVRPEVLERVLGFASEIATEGREGKPTGTIFVIGDTNSVNRYVRQLIINPFRGYSEAERSVLDPGLDETIKEFAAIDGAFVITGDGIVLSAGSYLRPQTDEIESLPSGFGSRHAAAAGITACTNALAITISESTGMVTLFKNGSIMMTLSKTVVAERGAVQRLG
jgi:DNA integrity scanning protein DisA with diadenylate cyclase activity/mannitol/fructose-specific phosphotransferase system IIA component (Ntr-type)